MKVPCPPGHFTPVYYRSGEYKFSIAECIECPDGEFQTDGYHDKCVKCTDADESSESEDSEKKKGLSTGGPGSTIHSECGINLHNTIAQIVIININVMYQWLDQTYRAIFIYTAASMDFSLTC